MFWSAAALAAWPELGDVPALGGGEGDAAVIVGIEDYFAAPDIPGARENAADWFRYLSRGRGIPVSRIHMLRDQEATDDGIRQAVERARGDVEAGATLWFVFIGHGAPSEDGRDGLLVGVDAQQTALGLASRSVARSELLDALEEGPQAATVAVIDACFSGRTSTGGQLAPGLMPLVPQYATTDPGGVTLFTAAGADQFAGPLPYGDDRPAFSYLLLGALQGWGDRDEDGRVTAREAADWTHEAFVALVKDRNQTPTLDTSSDGADLAEAFRGAPDMVELSISGPALAFEPKPAPVPEPVPEPKLPVLEISDPPVAKTGSPIAPTVPTVPTVPAEGGGEADAPADELADAATLRELSPPGTPSTPPGTPTTTRRPPQRATGPRLLGIGGKGFGMAMGLLPTHIHLTTSDAGTFTNRMGLVEMGFLLRMAELRWTMPGLSWGQFQGTTRKVTLDYASLSGGLELFSANPRGNSELLRLYGGVWGGVHLAAGTPEGPQMPTGWGPYVANLVRFSRLTGLRIEGRAVLGSAADFYSPTLGASFVIGTIDR